MKNIQQMLRSRGLRVTAQRTILLNLLHQVEGHRHFTAQEIHEEAETSLPGLNLATVYRTLEGLYEAGLVDRMDSSAIEQVRFSFRDPDHAHGHLCCRACGKVEEFSFDLIVDFADKVKKAKGFAIDRSHLTLSGLCRNCSQ